MDVKYNGLGVDLRLYGEERSTSVSPGSGAYAEANYNYVADWDELAAQYGANGETPVFAPTLALFLNRVQEKEWDAISELAFAEAADDFDPPDADDYDDGDCWP